MQVVLKLPKPLFQIFCLLLLLSSFATASRAQSTDIGSPYPVSSNDVVGTIAARDLGDARLTDHYYAFTGTPGDVLITVKSNNLNGDVDVFTAGSLRPLLKFTLYAENSSASTKGIYLRRREDLILRIEARSPNDDEGSYQIRFGGSFEPVAAPLIADATSPGPASMKESARTPRKGRRVSSVGARIYEPPPPPEPVATASPADTSVTPADDTARNNATPATTEEPVTAKPAKPAPVRRGRARGTTTRRNVPKPAKTKEPAATTVNKDEENAGEVSAPEKPARSGRSGKRRAEPDTVSAPDQTELQSGPRLIIEMLDGTRIERYMSGVRRVTVENNQIVVVKRDGKIERTRMTEVLRMTIEP